MSNFAEQSLSDESLQRELQNKDEIIEALTRQLEGTADQLDRLKRSGVKEQSGGRAAGGLASQVQVALEAFDELNPADHFERIESGIQQILQLISNGQFEFSEGEGTAGSDDEAGEEAQSRFWEETKARLLGGGEEPEPSQKEESSPPPVDSDSVEMDEENQAEELPEIPPIPDLPMPVESLSDLVQLEEGITQRDSYISYLIARLRHAESLKYPETDWDLIDVPEELLEEVENLKRQLEDHLRQAELAAALERASLTRERSKLFQIKQYLSEEVKRLGAISDADRKRESDPESRWGRFFDLKK